jgi:hypothetical protein
MQHKGNDSYKYHYKYSKLGVIQHPGIWIIHPNGKNFKETLPLF